MKRVTKITLTPRKGDALFIMQELALRYCLKHHCDIEFGFRDEIYLVEWREMSSICRPKTSDWTGREIPGTSHAAGYPE